MGQQQGGSGQHNLQTHQHRLSGTPIAHMPIWGHDGRADSLWSFKSRQKWCKCCPEGRGDSNKCPYAQAGRTSFYFSQTWESFVPSSRWIHDPSPLLASQNFLPRGLKKGSKFRGCLLPESSLFHGYTSLKGEQIARAATTREMWWYRGHVAWESSKHARHLSVGMGGEKELSVICWIPCYRASS